jgi:hypothetical protein
MDDAGMVVHSAVEEAYPHIVTPLDGGITELAHDRFAMLPPVVASTLLGQVLGLVNGDRKSPPLGALELLSRRLQRFEPLKGVTLHGCLVSSDEDVIYIRPEPPRRAAKTAARPRGSTSSP